MRFIIPRQPACRDGGQHHRARPVAIEYAARIHQAKHHSSDMISVGPMAGTQRSHAAGQPLVRVDNHSRTIQPRPAAQHRVKSFAGHRRMGHGQNRGRRIHHRKRNAPMRQTGQERHGAVDGVDHPHIPAGPARASPFLAQNGVVGKADGQLGANVLFDLAVGAADDILGVGLGFHDQGRTFREMGQGEGTRFLRNRHSEGMAGHDIWGHGRTFK